MALQNVSSAALVELSLLLFQFCGLFAQLFSFSCGQVSSVSLQLQSVCYLPQLFLAQPRSSVSCAAIPSMTDTLILGFSTATAPVPSECLRTDVVARCEAPNREESRRPPPSTVTSLTSAATVPENEGVSAAASKRDSQGWAPMMTSTTAAVVSPHHGCLQVHNLFSLRTILCRRPRHLANHQAFSHDLLLLATAHILASVRSIALCGAALMRPFRPTAKTIGTGAGHGAPSCLVRQADSPLSCLTFSLIVNRLPSSCFSFRSAQLASVYWLRTLMARGM